MEFARTIADAGGRALIVGGWVRDYLMGIDSKDVDIEVYNISQDHLERILAQFGEVNFVGKAFGVYKIGEFDISLPRTEIKTGTGHRGFSIVPDPFLSLERAVLRRDLTINALFYDPLENRVIDLVGGQQDLKTGTLRAVNSDTFIEDPLRVFRVMQFIARFQFSPSRELIDLCTWITDKGMLRELPPERIYEEFLKMLVRGTKPSWGLEFLRTTGVVHHHFPELNALIDCPQEFEWHSEGNVWNHTCMAIDTAIRYRSEMENPKVYMLAVLCHDFGKPLVVEKIDGRWKSLNHDDAGVEPTRSFLTRIGAGPMLIKQVTYLVQNHLKPGHWHGSMERREAPRKSRFVQLHRELAQRNLDYRYLMFLHYADGLGRITQFPTQGRVEKSARWFEEQMQSIFVAPTIERAIAPLITGRDLIAFGLKPGPSFRKVLEETYAYQIDNGIVDKDELLRLFAFRDPNNQIVLSRPK